MIVVISTELNINDKPTVSLALTKSSSISIKLTISQLSVTKIEDSRENLSFEKTKHLLLESLKENEACS